MTDTPIVNQLLMLNQQSMVSFHMPGHKNGNTYNDDIYKNFKDNLINIDTTEIPGTDNLFKPKDSIRRAQQQAAEVFGSQETFFLVNGSTGGIYSMIMAATKPKDKIIISRNCHKSVINSILLADLEPVFIYPEIDYLQGIAMGIDPYKLEELLQIHPDAKAVVITYPTYHGIACDLKKIAEIIHKYDKILLVDEAHGAHLGLSKELPATAMECGADAVVQSTHKTLPSFTQSSMLHVQGDRIDRDKLRFMLQVHQSSSPSYILMASLDMATMIYKTQGKSLMEQLLEDILLFKEKAQNIEGLRIINKDVIGKKHIKDVDITKLWISLSQLGITGALVEERLRNSFKVQMELSNLFGTLAITTIGNRRNDFERLLQGLKEISKDKEDNIMEGIPSFSYGIPKQAYNFKEAIYKQKTATPLEECNGGISGEFIIPYPPGIPLVIPGEIINAEILQQVKLLKGEGIEIIGPRDNNCEYIDIIKD